MAKLPVEFILHTLFLVSITTAHKQSNGRSIRTINNEFCSDISSVERFSHSLALIVLEKYATYFQGQLPETCITERKKNTNHYSPA